MAIFCFLFPWPNYMVSVFCYDNKNNNDNSNDNVIIVIKHAV